MKRFTWAVLLLPWAAACSGIAVRHDYDPEFDFSKLRTYVWHAPPPGTPGVDTLTHQRIVRAVDEELAARGYQKSEGAADFKVHAMASIRERISTQPVTIGVGYGWGYGTLHTVEGTEVTSYEEGTLIVDVVEPAKMSLLWRGTARAAVERDRTPEQREARIREAVAKILEPFPPKKKKK